MMTRIFIEGLPATGKSTLLYLLERQKYRVVHELGHVLPPNAFPGDGLNLEHMLSINDWFIAPESERFVDDKQTIYDRSFLTHLSYAYAYSRYSGIDGFAPTMAQYALALAQERLFLPDTLIYLNISPEESINRQRIRIQNGEEPPLPSFWRDTNFLHDLKRADYALFDSMQGIKIVCLDATLSTEEKYSLIPLEEMNSLGPRLDLDAFRGALDD
ncbi:MAG TPA: hypothetical protein PLX15_02170 [Candidatus Woesearchaeota archaeon]|nr:hypothetical protein [Candidatus Woesearchaeota archaeon]